MVVGAVHRIVLASFILVAGALAFASISAEAQDDIYKAFIAVGSLHYDIGDTVEVSVWTLNRGVPEDPVALEVWVGVDRVPIECSRESTGRYSAEFALQGSQLEGEGWCRLGARGTFLNSTSGIQVVVGESNRFQTDLTGGLLVDIVVPDVEDEHVGTCQTVDFWVRSSFKGIPVDLDPGSLVIDGWIYGVTTAHTGLGLYECTFEMPESPWVNESHGLLIDAIGNYTLNGWTAQDEDQRMVLLNFFRVWFHRARVTETDADVEVVVLDREGLPVEGASVELEYSDTQWAAEGSVEGVLTGTTDADGRAPFTVDYSLLNASKCYVYFLGEVEHEGKHQNFDECIRVRDPTVEPPARDTSDELFSDDPLPPDVIVALNHTIVTGIPPLPQRRVLVSIWSQKGLHYCSELYSDSIGNISVTFRTPSLGPNETSVELTIEMDFWSDTHWGGSHTLDGRPVERAGSHRAYNFWDYWLDGVTTISATIIDTRGPVRVVLDHPIADGSQEKVGVAWGFGVLPRDRDPAGATWRWTKLHCCNWNPYDPLCWVSVVECSWNGSAYVAVIDMPDFIVSLGPMWFYGAVQFLDSPATDIRGVYVENVTLPLEDNLPPGLTIEVPAAGSPFWGVVEVRGTAWDDFSDPVVEVRVDGGDWRLAIGDLNWSYYVYTEYLAWGEHTLEARSFDGFLHSNVVSVTFRVDNPPWPPWADLDTHEYLSGLVEVGGTASDDSGVILVEIRIDGGQWVTADGQSSWSHTLDTTKLSYGTHTYEVRSYDGTHHSTSTRVLFKVDNPPVVELDGEWGGTTVQGTVTLTGRAYDDNRLYRIEVRIGTGAWAEALGTAEWSFGLDTTLLGHEDVQVVVRAYDGHLHSQELVVTLHVDNPPAVTGSDLLPGARLYDVHEVNGAARDDGAIDHVEFQVDEGVWARAGGTDEWTFALDTNDLSGGPHTLRVRAFDGTYWSEVYEAAFVVDRRPTVRITSPGVGEFCNGTMLLSGTASDDGEVRYVEFCFDNGIWRDVAGREEWSSTYDSTGLSRGHHRLVVRAFDGMLFSESMEVPFVVDQPPVVTILSPTNMSRYSDNLMLSGVASDDGTELIVEWRLDGGPWHIATGSTVWQDTIDCDALSSGKHRVEVRAFDGVSRSPVQAVEFEVVGGDDGGPNDAHWASTYVIGLAILIALVAIAYWRLSRERPPPPEAPG